MAAIAKRKKRERKKEREAEEREERKGVCRRWSTPTSPSPFAFAAPYRSLLRRSNRGERKLAWRKGSLVELVPSRQRRRVSTAVPPRMRRDVSEGEKVRGGERERALARGVGAASRRRAVRSHHRALGLTVVVLGATLCRRRWG
ncbi:hypothetical protein AAHE18_08G102900 [Arachis hypogaea]|nr:uncharacterized protein DS421_8g233760 [Arachis hypogaea]